MTRTKMLSNGSTRAPLTVLAVLLLLCGLAFPGTARAQAENQILGCFKGLELPAELAELDLEGLRAALQELVAADTEVTVTLIAGGEEHSAVRADLLLADDAVLLALLEGQPVNVTGPFPGDGESLIEIVAIEVSTAEDCEIDPFCVEGVELPAALADLDVAGLRAALEGLIAADADTTVTALVTGAFDPGEREEAVARADLLLGLADPVLEALLAGDPLSVALDYEGTAEIVSIALPGPECEEGGGAPEPGPKPGTTPDSQQGGGDKVPDNQQTGGDKDTGAGGKTPDNQQGGGKTPDNQQSGGGDTVTKTFELTINGTVPADQVFAVKYGQQHEGDASILVFCGEMEELADFPGYEAKEECVGDGTVYSQSVELPKGAVLYSTFTRYYAGGEENFFASTDGETLNTDMTNTAWYTFGTGTGAGDDQQDDAQDDGTDAGDDTQDDQQGEMPEEMPETGAGGLAPGATIPVGNAAAGLTLLIGAAFAALRSR